MKFILENWTWLLPSLYEISVRLFPSERSYSIANGIKNLMDIILPNISKNGQKHK